MGRVEWHDDAFIQSVDLAVADAAERGAEFIADKMRANATHDKEMQAAITVKKSQFKDGGFVVGVFSDHVPDSGKWEDSLAARAIYQDFGHAVPYQGRGNVKRSKIVKSVTGNHFIRKALRSGKRAVLKFYKGALKG